jgi:hypothetical protein
MTGWELSLFRSKTWLMESRLIIGLLCTKAKAMTKHGVRLLALEEFRFFRSAILKIWIFSVGQLHVTVLVVFQYDLGHHTPLYKALSEGKMGPAARILEKIESRFDVELKDKEGDMALHLFIHKCNDPTSVASILDSFWRLGVDFNAPNKNGLSPLHLCILNRAVRGVLVDWFLKHLKVHFNNLQTVGIPRRPV